MLEWNRRAVRKDPAFERWWEETGFRELNQLLYWRWDPLGVADFFPATEESRGWHAEFGARDMRPTDLR